MPFRPRFSFTPLVGVALLAAPLAGQPVAPELPRGTVDTRMPTQSGRTIRVRAGDDLQDAINDARYGDVIALEPGATFEGNFVLRRKRGDGWIVIRSAVPDAELPQPGTRMTPARAAGLAKVVTPNNEGAFMAAPGARGYRLLALDVGMSGTRRATRTELVRFGAHPNQVKSLGDVGRDFVLDRSYVHAAPDQGVRRCVTLNADSSAVVDSYLAECHAKGFDSQAVLIWNANGPFLVQNNYLEGAGENMMVGGAEVSLLGAIRPSDITVRGNHFFKPTSWKKRWSVKNIFELKVGHRVLVEENLMENNWKDAQAGFAVLLKTNANDKDPGQGTTNVTFRRNVVRNTLSGINIYHGNGNGTSARRIAVVDNLFATSGGRALQLIGPLYDIAVERNTFATPAGVRSSHSVVMEGRPSERLTFARNRFGPSRYGVFGSGKGRGQAAFDAYWRDHAVTGNAFGDRAATPAAVASADCPAVGACLPRLTAMERRVAGSGER